MDFLKEEFLDQLRAEIDENTGKVLIEAAEFTPQQILQDISPTTFDTAFSEWCDNRRQERLDKAEEILELHGNKNRFRALKVRFERSAIIPFVEPPDITIVSYSDIVFSSFIISFSSDIY